jgi:hypothetical protein
MTTTKTTSRTGDPRPSRPIPRCADSHRRDESQEAGRHAKDGNPFDNFETSSSLIGARLVRPDRGGVVQRHAEARAGSSHAWMTRKTKRGFLR